MTMGTELFARMLLLAAAASLGGGCKPTINTFAPPPPPEVTVAHPIQRSVTRYLEYTGTTEAYRSVDLRARVPGFLEQVLFQPGAAVKQGDLLFVIDKRTYQAAVDRASAQVLADEAEFKAAESEARIAEELATQRAGSEIDRITKIGRRDAAHAALEAAQAALASARLDLEYCEVRAPIDGRITKNLVDIGNLVGAAGEPTLLARVVSARPIYVSVDASESDLMLVRRSRLALSPEAEPGQIAPGEWRPVDLMTADSNEFDVHGRIDYVDPALDPLTGTIRVRCRFENENEILIPGLFVRVRVFLETSDAILVPDVALLSDASGRYALVVDEQGVVQARRVKIGALDGAARVVLEGLSVSDRVIVNGLQRARPGAEVKATVQEADARQSRASPTSPAPASRGWPDAPAVEGVRV